MRSTKTKNETIERIKSLSKNTDNIMRTIFGFTFGEVIMMDIRDGLNVIRVVMRYKNMSPAVFLYVPATDAFCDNKKKTILSEKTSLTKKQVKKLVEHFANYKEIDGKEQWL